MTDIRWERYPLLTQRKHTRTWLQIQGNLGLASNTIEAYGRALENYLRFCQNQSIAPEAAGLLMVIFLMTSAFSRCLTVVRDVTLFLIRKRSRFLVT